VPGGHRASRNSPAGSARGRILDDLAPHARRTTATYAIGLGTLPFLGARTSYGKTANCDFWHHATIELETSFYAGISARLDAFCAAPENRGVPGSSPGLAIAKTPVASGFSCFRSEVGAALIGYWIGHSAPNRGDGATRKPSVHRRVRYEDHTISGRVLLVRIQSACVRREFRLRDEVTPTRVSSSAAPGCRTTRGDAGATAVSIEAATSPRNSRVLGVLL
jgi:hypothetical protein